MSKHTPGPWKIGTPPPNGEQTIGTVTGFMVAVATTGLDLESAETQANAQLISAAPDLLAALKSVLAMPDWDGTMLTSAARKQAKRRARAAIAKAGG